MLLKAATLSKAWRARALDRQLWRHLFDAEGWSINIGQIRKYEEEYRARLAAAKNPPLDKGKSRARRAEGDDGSHLHKRQVRESTLFGRGSSQADAGSDFDGAAEALQKWGEQNDPVEADDSASPESDTVMRDAHDLSPASPSQTSPTTPSLPSPTAPNVLSLATGFPTVNWLYLYQQKKRLEENWNAGRFTNFQLPAPSFRHQAHSECVYTIQYSGKYLVSGSRDKTIRIWNLDTQSLCLPPLRGHTASVLCLQFDERPDQDILVSGGSDCHVFIWQFSTGKLIKKLEKAHSESVLNLRFDDKHLITCSKDKTIKVWNRRQMSPGDNGYPVVTRNTARFPSYIINVADIENQFVKPLDAFSELMTLQGHTAAVNAVQLHDGEIVSASGDRTVKIWDVTTGSLKKTFNGHQKGIACVQFDGRRVVSGSSDETVRIFDSATTAEVACLRGHSNLVRTVQARFGDIPGREDELEAEARAVDRKFFEARQRGEIPEAMSRDELRQRNAGSSNPRNIFAYGAKLPPGGGGSRWARIVSGSYDETIIIWRRDSEGKWVIAHRLFQWEAAQRAGGHPIVGAASRRLPGQHHQPTVHHPHGHPQPNTHTGPVHGPAAGNGQASQQGSQSSSNSQNTQQQTQQASSTATTSTANATTTAHSQAQAPPQPGASTQQQNTAQQQHQVALHQNQNPNPQPQPQPQHHHHHHHHHHIQNLPGHQAAALNMLYHAQHPAANLAQAANLNSRVFKLQFDSRRIVCCSQDPVIVGWDFANGDADLETACQFFSDEA